MGDTLEGLWGLIHTRQDAIKRLYPNVGFRYTRGGGHYDPGQPSVVFVIFHDDNSHGVVYDHELTCLIRRVDAVMNVKPITLSSDHPVRRVSLFIEAAFALAQSEETWTDEVQERWAAFMTPREDQPEPTES
jgi:hypothetical protein